MTKRNRVVATPDDAAPCLPHLVQGHLGKLLTAVYEQTEPDPDMPEQLSNLLARLDLALAHSVDRQDEAFRAGMLKAVPALRGYAMTLARSHAAADDLVQDTLLRGWRARARFESGTNIDAWLFTIMRNQFYTGARKHGREVPDVDGALTAQLSIPPEQAGHLDLQDVQSALARLPQNMREALLLIAVEDMSYEQAAKIMGCQVGTMKSRVSRARDKLAALLGYDGGEVGNDSVTLSAMRGRFE